MSSKTFLQPPVELCTVASQLRDNGNEINLFDFRATNSSLHEAISLISEDTDVCVVTTSPYDMTQMYHSDYRLKYCFKFIKELKRLRSRSTVVVIGVHGTLKPRIVLEETNADILVKWEIDQVIPKLIECLSSGREVNHIPNLIINNKGNSIYTTDDNDWAHPDLSHSDLIPAWDLVDFSKYFGYQLTDQQKYKKLERWGVILGSRGCPYDCNFCFNFYGARVRYRTIGNIIKELKRLEKENLQCIFFLDMSFTLNRKWALELCGEIIREGINLTWICQTRCDLVDLPLLGIMSKAGCISIQFGVESVNDKVLSSLKKGIDRNTIKSAIDLCKQANITPGAFLMVGTPFDTPTSVQETIDFLQEEKIPFIPIIYTPRLGSLLGDEICEKNQALNWEEMLELRGKVAPNYSLHNMVGDHAKLRGQSFRTSTTNFEQPMLKEVTHHHRNHLGESLKLKNTDQISNHILQPADKELFELSPFISFPLTTACPFKCIYCGIGGENTISNVNNFDLTTLMDVSIIAMKKGIRKVRLTGGEPTTHPEFGDILRFLSEQGFYTLVNTNGLLLEKKKFDLMRPRSNMHCAVSLVTLKEDRFDSISQTKGHFKQVIRGIDILSNLGLLMRINMVVGQFNLDEVFDMIEFCRNLGCDLKLQEISSVPYPHLRWSDIHQGFKQVEEALIEASEEILLHRYASAFGIPVKIYLINGVYVTLKALHYGSRFDINGFCKGCPHFPCHEGLYDIYVLGDGSIASCRWKRFGSWQTFDQDLETAIAAFRRSQHLGEEYQPQPMNRVGEACEDTLEKFL
jgi:molybdenum cofactor biosynthesis enzyme MoaA/tRNA A37 methylthiotransferase MiaB